MSKGQQGTSDERVEENKEEMQQKERGGMEGEGGSLALETNKEGRTYESYVMLIFIFWKGSKLPNAAHFDRNLPEGTFSSLSWKIYVTLYSLVMLFSLAGGKTGVNSIAVLEYVPKFA